MKLYIPNFVLFKGAQAEDPLSATNEAAPPPAEMAQAEPMEPAAEEPVPADLVIDPSIDPVEELKSVLTGLLGEDTDSEERELDKLDIESEESTDD